MIIHEISDDFWRTVEPLLAPFKRTKSGGSPSRNFRSILNGIFYVLKLAANGRFLPRCYGSKSAVHEHFHRWSNAGVFAEIFRLYAQEGRRLG